MIFVDNASNDGSVEFVRRLNPGLRLELVANSRNLGFAEANNRALDLCRADYIALLNNDTEVAPDWLSLLVETMDADASAGIAGSRQVPQESSRLIDPKTGQASWCSGGHCLIRRSALERTGFFDEKFFMYAEDVDLCWRMWLAGLRCLNVPQAVCLHHHRTVSRHAFRRTFYHVRNSILLCYAYGTKRDACRKACSWLKESLACFLKRRQWGRALAMLLGVIAHPFLAVYFCKKGAGLKAMDSFSRVRRDWIRI